MRLLFYINNINHGGAERVISNLVTQFSQNGHEVTLVTSFRTEWEYQLGEKVSRVSLFNSKIKGAVKRNFLLVKGLRKQIKEFNPDVVVSFMAEPNFRSIIATRGLKCKLLLSVRSDPNKEYGGKILSFLAKALFKKADGIVFQTEDAKSWFPKKIQQKSKIIYNQVDDKFFENEVLPSGKDIVTAGRLTSVKRHDLLIKAFSKIYDKIDGNLVIYGDGPLKNELQTLIDDLNLNGRVVLAGQTSDVVLAYKNAGVFVLSSKVEGMPNALLEAMAVGLPCISTDCPCGGPKAVLSGGNGVLVPINNVDALADAMLTLSNDDALKLKYSLKAKEKAKEFSPSVVYKEWEGYISNL